jgi:alpha-L-rhamnosidase
MEDKEHYDRLSGKIFHSFNDRFYFEEKGIYGNGGQTSMSLALYLDLVPEDQMNRVIRNLLEEIQGKNFHIDAGVVGTRMMIKALTRLGFSDIMYQIANQPDFPGWGYWVNQGASTLWQTWEGNMSLNHIMFGSIGEWFYSSLAGIRIDPENPGFKKIILKPEVTDSLEWVAASHKTQYGNIISHWESKVGNFKWKIEIPVNTKAKVFLPVKYGREVFESGESVKGTEHLKISEIEDDHWVLEIPSGSYEFEVR